VRDLVVRRLFFVFLSLQTLAPIAVPHPPFLKLKDVVALSYAKEIGT
jgi:hypothetical protein